MFQSALKMYLDFHADENTFRQQVDYIIDQAEKNGKSVPIPLILQKGEAFLGQIALMLSSIDCSACESLCCRKPMEKDDLGVGLIGSERKFFQANGIQLVDRGEMGWHMPYPCKCYSGVPGKGCTIYDKRPLSCTLFPFQPGGFMGENAELETMSLNTICPEGKRLAKEIYLLVHRIKVKMDSFTEEGI